MNTPALNIKLKIALHSFSILVISSLLLLVCAIANEIPIAKYLLIGLSTGEIISILSSKRKFLTDIHEGDTTITINYLNRMLIKKSLILPKEGLDFLDIKEVNWWYGRLDIVRFSQGNQNWAFECVDRKFKEKTLASIDNC